MLEEIPIKNTIVGDFQKLFGTKPLVIRSPARINLIGEHTDYNDGFVLPAAINRYIYIAVQKRDDQELHIQANEFSDYYTVSDTNEFIPSEKLWPNYLLGVLNEFKKRGHVFLGISALISGNIPQGAGLSSSAALECAFAYSINELFGMGYQKMDLVQIAKAAENNFVGVQCGIMDQFASMFGQKEKLIKLDCHSLNFDYVPLVLHDVTVTLFDTRVKHSLADSAYNKRRQECFAGVELVKRHVPTVKTLRDVTEEMLKDYVYPVDKIIFNRCSYVVSENTRVLQACEDLKRNDLNSFGEKMYATHMGLKDLYEVSCEELDFLITLCQQEEGVLGARMMGGGFGGCTINLIHNKHYNKLITRVCGAYESKTGLHLRVYPVKIIGGTEIVTANL